jgi:Cysteine dioxygenase type I
VWAIMSLPERRGLSWLVKELDQRKDVLDRPTAQRLLSEAKLSPAEVAPYLEQRTGSYNRRCIVRRENYELLVLTWAPSQGSVAHDHSGSLCGLKVAQGRLTEQVFEERPDGQVRKTSATGLTPKMDSGWSIQTSKGRSIQADLAVITIGHRPPDDPLARLWAGPRRRIVADP